MNNSVFHANLKQILGMPIRNLKKVELKNNLIGKVFCSWCQSCFLLIIILITSWLDIFPFMLITIIFIITEYNLWLQGLDFIFTLTEIKQATPLLSSHQKVVNKMFSRVETPSLVIFKIKLLSQINVNIWATAHLPLPYHDKVRIGLGEE